LPFVGVLEMIAAPERLEPKELELGGCDESMSIRTGA
jgi:hypothetical protein